MQWRCHSGSLASLRCLGAPDGSDRKSTCLSLRGSLNTGGIIESAINATAIKANGPERVETAHTPASSSFVNHKGGSLALILDKVRRLMTAAHKALSGDTQRVKRQHSCPLVAQWSETRGGGAAVSTTCKFRKEVPHNVMDDKNRCTYRKVPTKKFWMAHIHILYITETNTHTQNILVCKSAQ